MSAYLGNDPALGANNAVIIYNHANAAFDKANTGTTTAIAAFSQANNGTIIANNAYNEANTSTGYKNRIIGGDFGTNPWQRGTTFASLATATYSADRFVWHITGSGAVTITKDTSSLPNTTKPTIAALKIAVTTANTNAGTSNLYFIAQKIEGLNCADLGYGSGDAKTVTVSFDVRSNKTGIHSLNLVNLAGNRGYVAEYTVNVADTWERKEITIPGDTSGTWLTTNGVGLWVIWPLNRGTDSKITAGSWGTTGFACSSNQVNVMDSTSNTFYLANIQLEVGNQATAFENRSFGQEALLCQRYYEKSYDYTVNPGTATRAGECYCGNTPNWTTVYFIVNKRIVPTFTVYSPNTGASGKMYAYGGATDGNPGSFDSTGTKQCSFMTGFGFADERYGYHYTADAEL